MPYIIREEATIVYLVDILLDRASVLQEILKIEDELRSLRLNPTYRALKENMTDLRKKNFGSSIVVIASPDNLNNNLRMRVNSSEMRDVLSRYKERQSEFEEKMIHLETRKNELQKQLFKA